MIRMSIFAVPTVICLAASAPAGAEVRFGKNVFVGGHDFSNQTFDSRHRALVHLHLHPPRHAGCRTQRDGRGGVVKVCHLQTLRRR
jgi:hypothetical protein